MKRFALIGAAGYIAPRHLEAIKHVGGELVAALDLHDSVGIMDRYFPDARFFTSPERFDRFLNKHSGTIDYVVICSPNWLHDAHCRWALRSGANAICEKPAVIKPWNLDELRKLEQETERKVHPILQMRLHPAAQRLKEKMDQRVHDHAAHGGTSPYPHVTVELDYITRRGKWYWESWKGHDDESGTILMNLGIHFFDLACWLFGTPRSTARGITRTLGSKAAAGRVDFDLASMKWFLSTRQEDLPPAVVDRGGYAHRLFRVDGELVDFSQGFDKLHNLSYEEIFAGRGFSLDDAKAGLKLVHSIRTGEQP